MAWWVLVGLGAGMFTRDLIVFIRWLRARSVAKVPDSRYRAELLAHENLRLLEQNLRLLEENVALRQEKKELCSTGRYRYTN